MIAKYYCWSRKVRGEDGGRTRVMAKYYCWSRKVRDEDGGRTRVMTKYYCWSRKVGGESGSRARVMAKYYRWRRKVRESEERKENSVEIETDGHFGSRKVQGCTGVRRRKCSSGVN